MNEEELRMIYDQLNRRSLWSAELLYLLNFFSAVIISAAVMKFWVSFIDDRVP